MRLTRKMMLRLDAAEFHMKSIVRSWRDAASCASGLIILSPYITSRTAESVVNAGLMCEVYTLFEVEVFASGASSLKTLKTLAASGHELVHLPNFHAKVVLSPGAFVSVGSQNLTQRGTKNKELSAVFSAPETSLVVAELIKPWLAEREPITDDMIADMEALVVPVRKLFSQAYDLAVQPQKEFDGCQAERAAAEKRRLVLEAARAERLRCLRYFVAAMPKSREVARGRVVRIEIDELRGPSWPCHTLLCERGRDFSNWTVNAREEKLLPLQRYLCLREDNGWIGWARVARTRITFVENELGNHRTFAVDDVPYYLRFTAERATESAVTRNLLISIECPGSSKPVCEVSAWFSPAGMEILSIRATRNRELGKEETLAVVSRIRAHRNELADFATRAISTPFDYFTDPFRGVRADGFFGDIGSEFLVHLTHANGNPVLIANVSSR